VQAQIPPLAALSCLGAWWSSLKIDCRIGSNEEPSDRSGDVSEEDKIDERSSEMPGKGRCDVDVN
jgi:hypothetical protein